ncbi:retrotransposon protein, putative, ty1-copia subclass [Tanacetum coccineum]
MAWASPKMSYLKVLGCEALVKRDTLTKPDKLEPISIKCIFIGYPKETMGYSFYYPPENKVLVARNVEFFENSLITQEARFVNPKHPNQVCKLKRSIYGLKQASRQWNKLFDDEIKKFGFSQNRDEPCVYMKASGSNVTFLILYVDDILIMGTQIPMLQDSRKVSYVLGIKIYIDRSRRLIGLCQSAYVEKILKRINMENSKREIIPMKYRPKLSKSQGASKPDEVKRMQRVPYASAIGSIMGTTLTTVKKILKYLRNTKDMFLVYGGDIKRELKVACYNDVGYLIDVEDSKYQTGYVFILNGGAIDSKSTEQSILATSSAEAEYIAALDASKEALHFVEEPLEIVGREVKRLKRSRIPLVKVRWNSKRGPEFTWEREDQFKKKYPHLFTKTTPSSSAAS